MADFRVFIDPSKAGRAVDKLRQYAKDCGEDLVEGEPSHADLEQTLCAMVQYMVNGVLDDPIWYLNDTSHSLLYDVFETTLRRAMGEGRDEA